MVSIDNKIIITNFNESYVKLTGPQNILFELRDYFSFTVPGAHFSPKFKSKVWDGKIHLLNMKTHLIYRGLVTHIQNFLNERNYVFEYEDEPNQEFSIKEAMDFIQEIKPKYEPRDYQVTAFIDAIRYKRKLFVSAVNSGKSLILYLILRYLLKNGLRGLILVPTVSLVEQLANDFKDYSEGTLWDAENHICKIYSGQEKNNDVPITISTWQSLFNFNSKYFHQYDFIITDECHLATAKSLIHIITSSTQAKYRIGLTGTLKEQPINKFVLEGLFGPEQKVITTKELIDNNYSSNIKIKCLVLNHEKSKILNIVDCSYQDEIKYLIESESRNRFIRNLALSLEGNTLLLFQYINHGKYLKSILEKENPNKKVYLIYGDVDVDVREDVRKLIETEENCIVVASMGTFSTGINIKRLHNIIFASPSKAKIKILQSIGRVLRKSEFKEIATLFDISDNLMLNKKINYTFLHFKERLSIYMSEKFKFKIYKIQLKE